MRLHISLGRTALVADETIRAFIGINIESSVVIANLEAVQREILASNADLKAVEPENLHITMRFLGDISRRMVDQVIQLLDKLDFEAFPVSLQGVGVFPKPNYPRVVWAGLKKGHDEVERIYGELEGGLRQLGFRPERGKYTPHVTLFRVRSGRARVALVDILGRLQETDFGEFQVKGVQLKRSVLTPKGPVYSTLGEARR